MRVNNNLELKKKVDSVSKITRKCNLFPKNVCLSFNFENNKGTSNFLK